MKKGVVVVVAALLAACSLSVPAAFAKPAVSYCTVTGADSMADANRLSIATGLQSDPSTITCGGSAAVKQPVTASGRNAAKNKAATTYRLSGYTDRAVNLSRQDLATKLISTIRASDYVTSGAAVFVDDAEAGDLFTMDFHYPLVGTYDGRPVSAHLNIQGTATGKSHRNDVFTATSTTIWGSSEVTCPVAHVTDLLFGGGYVMNATNVRYDLSFAYKDTGDPVAIDGSSLTVLSQNWYETYDERVYLPSSSTAKVSVLSSGQGGHMNVSEATTALFGETVVSAPLANYDRVAGNNYDRIGSEQFERNATQFSQTGSSFVWGASNFDINYSAPGSSVSDTYGVTGWFAFSSAPLVPVVPDNPVKTVDRSSAQPGDKVTYTVKQRMGVLGIETITTYKQMSFTDTLPEGLSYNGDLKVRDSRGTDITGAGTVSVEGQVVTFDFGEAFLNDSANYNGRDVTFTLSGTVADTVPDGSTLANKASTLFNDYYVRQTDNVTTDLDNKIDVHFVDGLTSLRIADVRVPRGSVPTAPEVPVHEGYEYKGWDKEIVPAFEETTYRSQYDRVLLPVTFVDGLTDETIHTCEVAYGDDAQVPATPEHEGYVPLGWDKPSTNIRKATTITMNYAPAKDVNYIVRYIEQGTGSDVAPSKLVDDAEFGSTAVEQAVDVASYQVVGEKEQQVVLDAYGKEIVFEYAKTMIPVHFVDGLDASSIDEQVVHQGSAAQEPEVPAHFGYEFAGWDKTFDCIMEETTVTALYDPSQAFGYTVRYEDTEGAQLAASKRVEGVAYLSSVTETAIDIDGYEVVGESAVTELIDAADEEIVFVYDKVTHKVLFQLPDGTPLKTEVVSHHGGATAPSDPTIEGKTFAGWDVPYDDVVDDLVVTAQFKDMPPASNTPEDEPKDEKPQREQESPRASDNTSGSSGGGSKETASVSSSKGSLPQTGDGLFFVPAIVVVLGLSGVAAVVAWRRSVQRRSLPFNFGSRR